MGVCVGYVKEEREGEWMSVYRLCERERERDRVGGYVCRLCKTVTVRERVGVCV